MVYGLYRVARECHQLHVPECRLKETAQRLCQQLTQTLPLLDMCIPALKTRSILICHMEESPLLTPPPPQTIPAPQQDRALAEPGIEISPELLTSIEDRHSVSDTPVHQVQPLLCMTPIENTQLWDRN